MAVSFRNPPEVDPETKNWSASSLCWEVKEAQEGNGEVRQGAGRGGRVKGEAAIKSMKSSQQGLWWRELNPLIPLGRLREPV